MKRHFQVLFAAFTLSTALATSPRAEDVDTSKHPDTTRIILKPYSIGLGVGAFSAINSELAQESETFLKLSLVQSVQFGRHMAMGVDIDWFGPGENWGGEMIVNYLMGSMRFRPFIGAGAGIRFFDTGEDFGQGLGPSGVVHAGIMTEVMDELQLRIRVPYHFVANKNQDRLVGLDMAFLFGSPLRKNRVKKLTY